MITYDIPRANITTADFIDESTILIYETHDISEVDVIIKLSKHKVFYEKITKNKPIFLNKHITKKREILGYIRRLT